MDRDQDGVCDDDDLAPDNPCTADGVMSTDSRTGRVVGECQSGMIAICDGLLLPTKGDQDDFDRCVTNAGRLAQCRTAACSSAVLSQVGGKWWRGSPARRP